MPSAAGRRLLVLGKAVAPSLATLLTVIVLIAALCATFTTTLAHLASPNPGGSTTNTPPREAGPAGGTGPSPTALANIPANYLTLYQAAAATCPGLAWTVLAGIGKIESDHGRSTLPGVHTGANSGGAQGVMQFLPSTWASVLARHPIPPGGSNPPSPYNPHDAIYTAAAYLCDRASPSSIRQPSASTPKGLQVTSLLSLVSPLSSVCATSDYSWTGRCGPSVNWTNTRRRPKAEPPPIHQAGCQDLVDRPTGRGPYCPTIRDPTAAGVSRHGGELSTTSGRPGGTL